jgi:cytochrome P450
MKTSTPRMSKRVLVIDPKTGLQILRDFMRDPSLLTALRAMAGHIGGFFQIPLPGFRPFVVAEPEANRKVLVTERGNLCWRNPDPVTDLLRRGVLVTDGEEHDHARSLMEPLLAPGHLPAYVDSMGRHVDRVTAAWQDGQTVDMLVEARKIALLIVMDALFGVDIREDLPRLWTPILKAIDFISPGLWILWRRIPRPGYKRHLAVLDSYLHGIISTRRRAPARDDLLQHLIDAGLDDDRIRDHMLTMMIAGHDTSTALLAWTFYLLGTHPDTYTRLVHELDGSLGGLPPAAPGGWQPKLLDEVIKEALRLYPPIHLGNRMAAAEVDFGDGRSVPAGERLFYSIYLTHRDPASWDRPDDFCPERFASGRKQPPFAYVPFGGGPRACIGAAFGQAEARIVLARLLQTFQFELVRKDVRPHMGATLEPRPGVFMRVKRRA